MPLLHSLHSGLLAYWPLHEPSGSRLSVMGDNSLLTLTDNNTVTGNPGIVEDASQFTAANSEYLSVADNALLSMGDIDMFMAIWVYLDTKPAESEILSKDNGASQREYAVRYLGGGTDRFNLLISGNGTANTQQNANTLGSPSTATWYFICAWHDSVANTINIRVNMGGVDSAAHTTGIFDGTSALNIGRSPFGAGTYLNGRACEAGIWKGRILTTSEQLWLYNNGKGRTYPFDGRYSPIVSPRANGLMKRRNRLTGVAN